VEICLCGREHLTDAPGIRSRPSERTEKSEMNRDDPITFFLGRTSYASYVGRVEPVQHTFAGIPNTVQATLLTFWKSCDNNHRSDSAYTFLLV
jgi:hypothetical protein